MATVAKDFVSRNGVQGTVLKSTISTGTAPLTVASTTLVSNLNANYLNGNQASAFGLVASPLSQFASTTSAQLAGVLSDKTGYSTGAVAVFSISPSLTTPNIGVATATSVNKIAITAPATSATLTIADGKTLTASNTLTFTGTDSSSVAFGSGGTVAYQGGTLAQFAATTSAQLAGVLSDETGYSTGAFAVFSISPAISTSITTASTTFALINTTATTVNFAGAATTISIGASTGTTTINNDAVVTGNLTVNGTTTTVNSTTLIVDDINIELGKVATPTDTTANGGGITLHGSTDKTITWDSTNANWTSSENWNIVTGKVFKINNVSVLSSTTLGSAVVNSSLTKIGALSSGTAGFVKVDTSGNLTSDSNTYLTSASTLDASKLSGTIPSLVLGNSALYIGSTLISLNRGSGSLVLTGITSIDGNAATATTASALGMTNAAINSKTVTVSTNATPTTIDSFSTSTYSSAQYLIQMKQGTSMTTTQVLVMWDGTDLQITEYGYVDATAGAANATITASQSAGTVTVTASSSNAATTNVVIKASVTYINS
jgi:hypothetical protein